MRESAAQIVARDRKLLLVRLELVVESLISGESDAAAALSSLWPGLRPDLDAHLSDPRLDEWTTSAEHLIRRGVHARYPDVHLARLTRGLSALAHSPAPTLDAADAHVSDTIESLQGDERQFVETVFAAAQRLLDGDAPWVAGLLRYDDQLDRPALLAAADADLAARDARFTALVGNGGTPDAADDTVTIDLGHGLRARKTRRNDAIHVEDWGAIDGLAALPDAAVMALLPQSPDDAGHYFEAIRAYRLGQFQLCVDHARRALAVDEDVEELWHLLAFAERHLGHRQAFEQIVFDRRRTLGHL